ncbi:hypothetical protein GCM10010365_24220 [Streptomyces poonensis]|uniref:HD Cas3-type domain-containing protein n=1 Tax=Streptomyces poonensis TaxID=68255 RepID=A0A918PG95_9ACTN|nr:hypothetical protein GCM10010365_24220 [Streptomyces poonensis]GLJ89366.1 hypothetical protein GCM10017589_19660 [Streptomyces poonensis]
MIGGGAGQTLLSRLSGAARSVWAKHDRDSDGWMPLWRHMEDSAAVAGLLWDEWLPASARRVVAGALPNDEANGHALVVWLAAVHDIGKATPAFACQVEQLADVMRAAGLGMRSRQAMGSDRRFAPHGLADQVLLGEWLEGGAAGRRGRRASSQSWWAGITECRRTTVRSRRSSSMSSCCGRQAESADCGGRCKRNCSMRARSGSGCASGWRSGKE